MVQRNAAPHHTPITLTLTATLDHPPSQLLTSPPHNSLPTSPNYYSAYHNHFLIYLTFCIVGNLVGFVRIVVGVFRLGYVGALGFGSIVADGVEGRCDATVTVSVGNGAQVVGKREELVVGNGVVERG